MAEIKFCTACGNELHIKAELCPKCGVRQASKIDGGKKTTAGILALLVGGLGVHQFYLGKPGRGILYLLFFWTFIPAIVSFIEGILLLTMTEEAFEAKYS
jgi:TM2 domain-containing membrane protein YozV